MSNRSGVKVQSANVGTAIPTASSIASNRVSRRLFCFCPFDILLYRLQEHGHIAEAGKQTADNRIRVYFKLTDAGRKYLDELLFTYHEMTDALDALLALDGNLFR